MSFSHQISVAGHRARLDCGTLGKVHELESALDSLLGEASLGPAFDLLVELGRDGPILDCTLSLAVVDALPQPAEAGFRAGSPSMPRKRVSIAALLIAMIGRHHGLRMESLRERITALEWLGGPSGIRLNKAAPREVPSEGPTGKSPQKSPHPAGP